jgi:hypothetical protein
VVSGRPLGAVTLGGEAAGRGGVLQGEGANGLRGGMRPLPGEWEARASVNVTGPEYGFSLVGCTGARWSGEESRRERTTRSEGRRVEEGRRGEGRRPRGERRGERLRRLPRWVSRRWRSLGKGDLGRSCTGE